VACALVACGGSPSVLNDHKTFVNDAGMDMPMGEAGDTSGGGSGINTDGGMMKMPEAGPLIEAGPGCGDGIVNQDSEECDDGNTLPGDGCSGACTIEDFSKCPPKGGACTSTIVCGDGKLEGSEVCDDGNTVDGDGCSSDCLVSDPNYDCSALDMMCVNLVVCGDGKVTGDEQCDDAKNPHGCLDDCSGVEPGYLCSQPGKPCVKVKVAVCGDGALDPGEQCDDGDNTVAGDGCSSSCTVDPGWVCPTAGVKCLQEVCGNGVRTPDEECDDGNAIDGDGCSTSPASVAVAATKCKVESGWVCPNAGKACIPKCGDGVKKGYETCEDGNSKSGDGCSSACLTEPGYVCNTVGMPCTKAVCGNSIVEADEGCDDGNTVYGDGCSGACQNEPTFTAGGVLNSKCGDGILTPSTGEVCDDGNTKAGDGCDGLCQPEAGFQCTNVVASPDFISLAVTYHDVRGSDEKGSNFPDGISGHPDFEHINQGESGLVGDVCTPTNHGLTTNTCGTLNAQGKPQLLKVNPVTVQSPASFASWYLSDPTINKTIPGSLTLARQGVTGATYAFDSAAFFPLDGNPLGFGNYETWPHDFGFTTEIDYFFQYGGGETLTFRGDDDVWVFVNRKLAVDIGGVHSAEWGRVILGDETSSCTVGAAGSLNPCTPTTLNTNADSRFDLVKGGIYQISLFNAERHTTQSNFHLTLSNFLPPHSQCNPQCGDKIVVIGEVCDDGTAANTGAYGACNSTCSARQFCGDGIQNGPEACDNGSNLSTYGATSGCSPGCVLPPKCGDANVDFAFGEQCDLGTAANTGAYNGCTAQCKLGDFCGDGHLDSPQETCDDGAANGGYGKHCGYDCEPGAFCGDGIKNGNEGCDLGTANNVGGYGGCKANCTQDIRCGDGVKNGTEQCDDGKNVGGYGKCAPGCVFGPRCGDGIKNGTEQCDDGTNDGSYGACAKDCKYGPRCGDGVVQDPETCDDGADNGKGDCSTSCQTQVTR
jgi:fibro-slime domain-containing protein